MPDPQHISALLGPVVARLASEPGGLDRLLAQVRTLGGCAHPVRLAGETLHVDASTGEVRDHYTTAREPSGELRIPCKNRRSSVCAACSETYRADTYHLIRAGVCGGDKGVPASVAIHPRVFVTLTAPSFGPVHRGPDKTGKTRPCHPRRTGPACFRYHRADDPLIGQPLDPEGYDYTGHVLWQAHAGLLWHRFMVYLRRHLAARVGLSQKELAARVRVSYAKVAEMQARGAVHFHAVIRLDGYTRTPGSWPPPPVWAGLDHLTSAIASAVRAVRYEVTVGEHTHTLAWGDQLDIRPIEEFGAGSSITDTAVAGYIAKYATKAAEPAGTLDRRIRDHADLEFHEGMVRPHVARLLYACWRLGNARVYPDLEKLKLRRWAHMLGFRGHFSTKSRRYSTTLGALRQARIDYKAGYPFDPVTHTPTRPDLDETILVVSNWRYHGQGLTPAEHVLATTLGYLNTETDGTRRCAHDR